MRRRRDAVFSSSPTQVGEGDHPAQQGGGRGAGRDESLSTKVKRRVRGPLHPAIAVAEAIKSRSRDAVFVRTRVVRHAIPKNDTVRRPSSEPFGRGWSKRHHDRARCTNERTDGKNKRKQNADRRGSPCFTLRRSAHPGQGALACRRSTAALPLGLLDPQGASAMLSGRRCFAERPPHRGRRPCASPRAGAETNPSSASTSRAGRCAGRLMSDAARVRRGRTLRPRAPHPLPPAVVTGWRPCTRSEAAALLHVSGLLSRIVAITATAALILRTFPATWHAPPAAAAHVSRESKEH